MLRCVIEKIIIKMQKQRHILEMTFRSISRTRWILLVKLGLLRTQKQRLLWKLYKKKLYFYNSHHDYNTPSPFLLLKFKPCCKYFAKCCEFLKKKCFSRCLTGKKTHFGNILRSKFSVFFFSSRSWFVRSFTTLSRL